MKRGSPGRRGSTPIQTSQPIPSSQLAQQLTQQHPASSQQLTQQQHPASSQPNVILQPMISMEQINDLLASIAGPNERLDPTLVPIVSRIADEFVEDVGKMSAALAFLRADAGGAASFVEARDVQCVLENEFRLGNIPGVSVEAEERSARVKRAVRSRLGTESHRARLAAARRASGR